MRKPGVTTRYRYRLRQLGGRLAWYWHWLLAGVEELAILTGLRRRYIPPSRLGLHVEGRTPRQAARRLAADPRCMPPTRSTEELQR